MARNYLVHWGIKGMKWGVRRYQNKDGTLTELGKKRMYREQFDMEGKEPKEQRKYVADANRWVGEDRQNTKRVIDEAAQMTGRLKNLNSVTTPESKKIKMDLSNMTDKQMRDEINRALLERQYNDMFAPQKTHKGREYLSQTLEIAGSVLAVGSSALGIALAVKQLKGG